MIKLTDIQPVPLKEMPLGINPKSQIFATNCTFEKGKNYLVIAPSGKGKSTFLHIIYGLRKDYEGTATVEEKNIQNWNPEVWSDYRQQKLSIVFQNLRLFDQLTGMENILLKSNLTNTSTLSSSVGVKNKVDIQEMAATLGVTPCLEQPCAQLSYGQRQRIAIIRALCQPFDFLLLDEPFSHLDEANIKLASLLIQKECQVRNAGVILVSLGEKYDFDYDETLEL